MDGYSGRNVELSIDTDAVTENLNSMASILKENEIKLKNSVGLESAWTSTNSTIVNDKMGEIDNSFAEMQGIIEKLQKKVEKYVENTLAADKVNINVDVGDKVLVGNGMYYTKQ